LSDLLSGSRVVGRWSAAASAGELGSEERRSRPTVAVTVHLLPRIVLRATLEQQNQPRRERERRLLAKVRGGIRVKRGHPCGETSIRINEVSNTIQVFASR
jgi:hypothetical protein